MLINMTCSCGAGLDVEMTGNDTTMLYWAHRFSNAHSACGFMLPPQIEVVPQSQTVMIQIKDGED